METKEKQKQKLCRNCWDFDSIQNPSETRRAFYCKRKLQRERQSSTGNEKNAIVKYTAPACEEYMDDASIDF